MVGVAVWLGVGEAVFVAVGVLVSVGVKVAVGVELVVGVAVFVGVCEGCRVMLDWRVEVGLKGVDFSREKEHARLRPPKSRNSKLHIKGARNNLYIVRIE